MGTSKQPRKRKALSQKLRFEVFRRDKFTCQYCGAKAPDVLLQCDHIEPHSKGGADHILNLITSCKDCNGGKGARRISEEATLQKTRAQLEELEARRQQLEMMAQWRTSLVSLQAREVELLAEHWAAISNYPLTDQGFAALKKLLKLYSFQEVADGVEGSIATYCKGGVTKVTANIAFDKLSAVCASLRRNKDNPDMGRIYYCRGILRNRFRDLDEEYTLSILKAIHGRGVPIDELEAVCKRVLSLNEFEDFATEVITNAAKIP
jgi:hypothetical protein